MPLFNCCNPQKSSDQASRSAADKPDRTFFSKSNLFTPVTSEIGTGRFTDTIDLIAADTGNKKYIDGCLVLPIELTENSRQLLHRAESEFQRERLKHVEYGDIQAASVKPDKEAVASINTALKDLQLLDFPLTLKDTFLIVNMLKRQNALTLDTLKGILDAFGRQKMLHLTLKKRAIRAKKEAMASNTEKHGAPVSSKVDGSKGFGGGIQVRENTLSLEDGAPVETNETIVKDYSLAEIEKMPTLNEFATCMGELANSCAASCSDDVLQATLLQATMEALGKIALKRFGSMFDQVMTVFYRSLDDTARLALANKAFLPINEGLGGYKLVEASLRKTGLIRLTKYDDKAPRKAGPGPTRPIAIPGRNPLQTKSGKIQKLAGTVKMRARRRTRPNEIQTGSSPKAPFTFSPS